MGTVLAVCISEGKGERNRETPEAELKENWGVCGDSHAGKGHRQVSLLSYAPVEEFRARGADAPFGAFGENLVVEGIRLNELPVGAVLRVGGTLLEITQVGMECHEDCAVRRQMGDCVMPRECVFARVLRGGTVRRGDAAELA